MFKDEQHKKSLKRLNSKEQIIEATLQKHKQNFATI